MRRYEIILADGKILFFDAEMDTLKEGCLILSKKKEYKGQIARADEKPEIVRIFSNAHWVHYGYTELA